MAGVVLVIEANLVVAEVVDGVLEGLPGEADLLDVVEDLVELVEADVVGVVLDVAVDVVPDFVVLQQPLLFALVLVEVHFEFVLLAAAFLDRHDLLDELILAVVAFLCFVDLVIRIDGRVVPV